MENKFLDKALHILEEEGKDEAVKYLKGEREKNRNKWMDLTFAMSEFTSKLYPNLGKGAHIAEFNRLFNDATFIQPVTKLDNMTLDEIIEDGRKRGISTADEMHEKLGNILENPAITPVTR